MIVIQLTETLENAYAVTRLTVPNVACVSAMLQTVWSVNKQQRID